MYCKLQENLEVRANIVDDSNNRDAWYDNYYSVVNVSASQGSFLNRLYHLLLEKNFTSNSEMNLLEVGANQGEHLQYVVDDYSSYILSDIREVKITSSNPKIKFQQANLESLPFDNATFDRVIATCVFHHVGSPEQGFEEVRRVLKDGGSFSLMLPNDPGLAYRAFRRLTSLRKSKKIGIYSVARLAHAREHRNHYLSLKTMLEWVFRGDQISYRYFPSGLRVYDINLLTVCTVTIIKPQEKFE